jgi:hypothetical protein
LLLSFKKEVFFFEKSSEKLLLLKKSRDEQGYFEAEATNWRITIRVPPYFLGRSTQR